MKIYFVTHPQVAVDPTIPVCEWRLSDIGRERMVSMLKQPWVQCIQFIGSSHERKALDAAAILARNSNVLVQVFADLAENDRTSTGYLAPDEFHFTADLFFAHPDESIRSWETARAAQRRIIKAVEDVVAAADGCRGDVAILAHGGVGALLLCHLKAQPISRREDQPGAGGGNYFVFEARSNALLQGWRPIEQIDEKLGATIEK